MRKRIIGKNMKVKFLTKPKIKSIILEFLNKNFDNVEETEEPDFLFFDPFCGNAFLQYDCVRIYYTGENLVPDFNVCDYAIGMNRLEFGDRYLRYPYYLLEMERYLNLRDCGERDFPKEMAHRKFCNYVIFNGKDQMPERVKIIELLEAYKHVDSGGRYNNNVGGPCADKIAFQNQYKFSVTFENSMSKGYITEKLPDALAAGSVPIYLGGEDVSDEFNPRAFINGHDFGSLEELAEAVKKIDQDDDLYMSYLNQAPVTAEQKSVFRGDELEKFLVYICSQSPEKATRRGKLHWAHRYSYDRLYPGYWSTGKLLPRIMRKILRITGSHGKA